ncbi:MULTISPECIES: hypothetical protein [unclassified Xanthobacter]|uniref:hypothetical protein n=1 Tax=unclassified Xanthobacter TaxID=2623496 RepID=UPI001EE11D03|nr:MULTISPECIES: hypothetical protein [unclassified Xanthobacter]
MTAPDVALSPLTSAPAQEAPLSAAELAALDAAYVSPTYLRTPFREFLLRNDRGLYWLRAPHGVGKTLFVRGIIARRPGRNPAEQEGIDSATSSDVRAFGVHLVAGDPPAAVLAALDAAFAAECGPGATVDGEAQTPAEALLVRFRKWHAQVVGSGAKRLLVCLDGVEKLAEGAALPPPAAALPAGVIVLVTSRSPDGERPAGPEGATVRDVCYGDADYTDMLARYFKNRTRPLLRAKVVAHFRQLLETKAPFESGGRDNRLTNDPELRDSLKAEWKKLTNIYPRYTGLPLPITPLVGLLDQFDQLWADLIDHAERRFTDLAAMLDALTDGRLEVEAVADLPRGEGLLAHLRALPVA